MRDMGAAALGGEGWLCTGKREVGKWALLDIGEFQLHTVVS